MTWTPQVWVALLLGVVLQPFVFLYINRPRVFFVYLLAAVGVLVVDFYWALGYFTLLLSVLCPLHAWLLIRRYDARRARRWYAHWWVTLALYILVLMAIFSLRSFLYEPFSVPSASMSPTLEAGDRIVVRKLGFSHYSSLGINLQITGLSDPQQMRRGKIYVFLHPELNVPYVKRLLGLPGDKLEFTEQAVLVNGQALPARADLQDDQQQLFTETAGALSYRIRHLSQPVSPAIGTFIVPEGQYFFVGDNRDDSSDSRHWGPVSGESIIGEVVLVID